MSNYPNRTRSTVKLTRPGVSTKAQLDFSSELAIEYAQRWLHLAGGQKVPASGVIRRALEVYMRHLTSADTVPRSEFAGVRSVCHRLSTPAEEQQQARERLQALSGPLPWPPFCDVLAGYDVAAMVAEVNLRADALFNHAARTPRGRLMGLKPVPEA